ncbi:hypothetical protein BDZ89DRAFT_156241 [Hymenopellis radicata]|nr:hypothetical protein BDZ89DRAFT_156241 [Hymenopellis radicata]
MPRKIVPQKYILIPGTMTEAWRESLTQSGIRPKPYISSTSRVVGVNKENRLVTKTHACRSREKDIQVASPQLSA